MSEHIAMSHRRLLVAEIKPRPHAQPLGWGGAKGAMMWDPAGKHGGLDSVPGRAEPVG